jgi:hypothetical protein
LLEWSDQCLQFLEDELCFVASVLGKFLHQLIELIGSHVSRLKVTQGEPLIFVLMIFTVNGKQRLFYH